MSLAAAVSTMESDLAAARKEIARLNGLVGQLRGRLARKGRDLARLKVMAPDSGMELDEDDLVEAAPNWVGSLDPGQTMLVRMLAKVHPRGLSTMAIEAMLPQLDHAKDRNLTIVRSRVYGVRRRKGRDFIETISGGYRLSDAAAAIVKGEEYVGNA